MMALKTLAQSISRWRRSKLLPSGSPGAMSSSFLLAVWIDSKNLIDRLVANVEKPRRVPHRPLRETKTCSHSLKLRTAAYKFPKPGREGFKFEALSLLSQNNRRYKDYGQHSEQKHNPKFHSASSPFLRDGTAVREGGVTMR
jgi:hypothetical protein